MQASEKNVNDLKIAAGITISFPLIGEPLKLAVGSSVFNKVLSSRTASLGPLPSPVALLKDVLDAGYAEIENIILDANEPCQLNAAIIAQPAIEEWLSKRVTVLCNKTTRDSNQLYKLYDLTDTTPVYDS